MFGSCYRILYTHYTHSPLISNDLFMLLYSINLNINLFVILEFGWITWPEIIIGKKNEIVLWLILHQEFAERIFIIERKLQGKSKRNKFMDGCRWYNHYYCIGQSKVVAWDGVGWSERNLFSDSLFFYLWLLIRDASESFIIREVLLDEPTKHDKWRNMIPSALETRCSSENKLFWYRQR